MVRKFFYLTGVCLAMAVSVGVSGASAGVQDPACEEIYGSNEPGIPRFWVDTKGHIEFAKAGLMMDVQTCGPDLPLDQCGPGSEGPLTNGAVIKFDSSVRVEPTGQGTRLPDGYFIGTWRADMIRIPPTCIVRVVDFVEDYPMRIYAKTPGHGDCPTDTEYQAQGHPNGRVIACYYSSIGPEFAPLVETNIWTVDSDTTDPNNQLEMDIGEFRAVDLLYRIWSFTSLRVDLCTLAGNQTSPSNCGETRVAPNRSGAASTGADGCVHAGGLEGLYTLTVSRYDGMTLGPEESCVRWVPAGSLDWITSFPIDQPIS